MGRGAGSQFADNAEGFLGDTQGKPAFGHIDQQRIPQGEPRRLIVLKRNCYHSERLPHIHLGGNGVFTPRSCNEV